jgi:hypothetical protein
VFTIFAYDNSNVYVGGAFGNIRGDTGKSRIAKWDGTTWQRMGSGISNNVNAIYAVDNSNVYVGGDFANIGGDTNKKGITRWDGTTWQAARNGVDGINGITYSVNALSATNNTNVYVGGLFNSIGGDITKTNIAKWVKKT